MTEPTRHPQTGVALALLLVAFAGCSEEVVERAPVPQPVKIFEYRSEGATRVIEYPGRVSAEHRADIAFEVPGRIIELLAKEGQNASEGDVLARLDPRDFESDLAKETAHARAAEAEFERQKILFQKGVASRQIYDKALRSFEVTQARIDSVQKALDDSVLRAPFDGRIARVFVDAFQNIKAKETILTIQTEGDLEIVVAIPEQDAITMQTGLTLAERTALVRPEVSVSSVPGRFFAARLTEFSTEADPVTRTFSATLAFDAPSDISVLPGMTANVRIRVPVERLQQGATIPALAALADEAGNAYVWVVDATTMQVRQQPVTLGELTGADVAILSGLTDGDQVAVSGVHQLREGMTVRRFGE